VPSVPPLFLASLAGLFPSIAIPLALGWKTLSVFDAAFGLLVLWAVGSRSFRSPDHRLIAASALFCGAGWLAFALEPSPLGLRAMAMTSYSIVVFLLAAHLRIEPAVAKRVILWPLAMALVVAWVMLVLQNGFGVAMEYNLSFALPGAIRRLGGFTGGPALVLFVAMAIPLLRGNRAAEILLLLSSWATLSRAMIGAGVAILLPIRGTRTSERTRVLASTLAKGTIAASLVAYWFALIPADPARRQSLLPTFEPGAYRTLHGVELRMLAQAPVTGHGPGQFMIEFRNHSSKEEQDLVGGPERLPYWDPHSALLGLAVEQGLIGLSVLGWLAFEIYRRLCAGADTEFRAKALASCLALIVGGHFVDWFVLKGLWLWMGLLVAASKPAGRI